MGCASAPTEESAVDTKTQAEQEAGAPNSHSRLAREEQADLLKQLVEAGHRVVEFAGHAKSLEDVFLHVTEGRVQ